MPETFVRPDHLAAVAITAALPALRRQWAEEVAAAIETAGDARSQHRHKAKTEEDQINGDTRYTSYRDSARIVREYGEAR